MTVSQELREWAEGIDGFLELSPDAQGAMLHWLNGPDDTCGVAYSEIRTFALLVAEALEN